MRVSVSCQYFTEWFNYKIVICTQVIKRTRNRNKHEFGIRYKQAEVCLPPYQNRQVSLTSSVNPNSLLIGQYE